MGWHCHGFFPFGIFIILLLGFLIFRIVMFRRYHGGYRYNGFHESETILMRRLANGEISEEEYKRLNELLKSRKK